MPLSAIQLEYSKRPHRTLRRYVRRAVGLLLATAAGFGGFHSFPVARAAFGGVFEVRRTYRMCSNYVEQRTEPVFDEAAGRPAGYAVQAVPYTISDYRWRTSRAGIELSTDDYLTIYNAGHWPGWPQTWPTCWAQMLGATNWSLYPRNARVKCASGLRSIGVFPPFSPCVHGQYRNSVFDPCVFLHGLTTATGARRLVCVTFEPASFIWEQPEPFHATLILPPGFSGQLVTQEVSPVLIDWNPPRDQPLKLEAGQPDPADPAHFTIVFHCGIEAGVIDGRLEAVDRLVLRVRSSSGNTMIE